MNKYPQELYPTIERIMIEYPETRNSDIKLYKILLNKFYGTTDIAKIDLKADIFISAKRCRQKIQETNPYLQANKKTKELRTKMEQTYLDFVRNV